MAKFFNRKYVIIPIEEVENIDFNQVLETDSKSLRLSQDAKYTFVKFEGDTPDFLDGKTQYDHSEFLQILNDTSGIWHLDNTERDSLLTKLEDVVKEISWSKYNPFNWFS